MRPKVKICGITRLEDAIDAAREGADFLGFIFVRSSPRYIAPSAAREIILGVRALDIPHPRFVGVFVDAPSVEIASIVAETGIDLVQLHGEESVEHCISVPLPAIKAFRVKEMLPATDDYAATEWIMFDAHADNAHGGTGKRFDWSLLRDRPKRKFFLAGGLDPDNVGEAIRDVNPDGIDVSSGIEDSPGVKNRSKLKLLFDRINHQ